ncbi:MAG: hypothetical protein ACP5EN_01525 [Rhodovulum sp.]
MAVALWFLGREFLDHWHSIAAWHPDRGALAAIGGLALAYGGLLFLLAEGWHRIVRRFGVEPRQRTYLSFTATQVARYLPGNVAHLLGRALWLRGGPLSDIALARATAIEIALTPAGAVLALAMAAPFLPYDLPQTVGWSSEPVPTGAAIALAAAAIAGLVATLAFRRTRWLLAPLLLAMCFMGGLGAVFAGVAAMLGLTDPVLAGYVAIIAWLAGYVTPGAPGGLGVREAVLIALLGMQSAPEAVLLAALIFRVVTTLGDLACFSVGWLGASKLGARLPPEPLEDVEPVRPCEFDRVA